jgi:hypothetical protein
MTRSEDALKQCTCVSRQVHYSFSEVSRLEVSRKIGSCLWRAHVLDEHEEATPGAAQREDAERFPEMVKEDIGDMICPGSL